jgi:hypothetical protein
LNRIRHDRRDAAFACGLGVDRVWSKPVFWTKSTGEILEKVATAKQVSVRMVGF